MTLDKIVSLLVWYVNDANVDVKCLRSETSC